MPPRTINALLPSILASAKNPKSFDSALLCIHAITENLAERGFQFRLAHYPEPKLERLGCHAYRATITGPDAEPAHGYALGSHEDVSALALFEAFERHVFRTVLEANQLPEFSMTHLLSGETRALARCLVVGDGDVYPSTTSGMACHTSYEAGVLAACLELCERDVLLRQWFSKSPPTDCVPPASQLVEWIRKLTEPESFELTTGIYLQGAMPVATAVLISTRHRMAFIGTGAALTAWAALEKACRELLTVWIFDFLTWEERGSIDGFGPTNQIRRHHEGFDQVESFFRRSQTGRQKTVEPTQPTLESLADFFRLYDFSVLPVSVCTGSNSAPVLVRAYSPHALPLFHEGFPMILPADFAILKDISNSSHPY